MANKSFDDMRFVQDYMSSLDDEHKTLFSYSLKQLREKGTSWRWIHKALTLKDKSSWEKYGYGLLFTDSYKAQVHRALLLEKAEKENLDSLWVQDGDDGGVPSDANQKQEADKTMHDSAFDSGNDLYNKLKGFK